VLISRTIDPFALAEAEGPCSINVTMAQPDICIISISIEHAHAHIAGRGVRRSGGQRQRRTAQAQSRTEQDRAGTEQAQSRTYDREDGLCSYPISAVV
jgi:hypothetical protein